MIKIRIHSEYLEKDITPIKAVRDAVKDEMKIMVDANQAVTFSGPFWTYRRFLKPQENSRRWDVYWLEEPLYHAVHKNLGEAFERSRCPDCRRRR